MTYEHLAQNWANSRDYSEAIATHAERFFSQFCNTPDPAPELVRRREPVAREIHAHRGSGPACREAARGRERPGPGASGHRGREGCQRHAALEPRRIISGACRRRRPAAADGRRARARGEGLEGRDATGHVGRHGQGRRQGGTRGQGCRRADGVGRRSAGKAATARRPGAEVPRVDGQLRRAQGDPDPGAERGRGELHGARRERRRREARGRCVYRGLRPRRQHRRRVREPHQALDRAFELCPES